MLVDTAGRLPVEVDPPRLLPRKWPVRSFILPPRTAEAGQAFRRARDQDPITPLGQPKRGGQALPLGVRGQAAVEKPAHGAGGPHDPETSIGAREQALDPGIREGDPAPRLGTGPLSSRATNTRPCFARALGHQSEHRPSRSTRYGQIRRWLLGGGTPVRGFAVAVAPICWEGLPAGRQVAQRWRSGERNRGNAWSRKSTCWAAPADDGITKLRLAPVGFQARPRSGAADTLQVGFDSQLRGWLPRPIGRKRCRLSKRRAPTGHQGQPDRYGAGRS